MKALHAIALCAATALASPGLTFKAWATTPPSATPAAMQQILLPSHGSNLLGVFYLAAGQLSLIHI